ncbi:TIGR02147 family protein [bacterium]|nr:TIGR02147 family protein [bacterium]
MKQSVFDFEDYKKFVVEKLKDGPNNGRGLRRKLAEKIGCQAAYVSHVLVGYKHFSLEQAEAIARYFKFRNDETEFFLTLVEHNKAGTIQLKNFLKRQLKAKRESHQKIKNRVGIKTEISPEDQAMYYSSWHYQAVRMALTLPNTNTTEAISQKLNVPIERINEVLGFLLSRSLIKEDHGRYVSTELTIHLGNDSPLISKLHTNWRIHTLKNLDRKNEEDFHYSGAVTLSEGDFHKVRETLMDALVKSHNTIKPSSSERLCVLALDFYEM